MCVASHGLCIVRPTVAKSVKVTSAESAQDERHLGFSFLLFSSHFFPGSVGVSSMPATFKLLTVTRIFPQFPGTCPPPVVVACRVFSYIFLSILAAFDSSRLPAATQDVARLPAATRDSVYVGLANFMVLFADLFSI